MSAPELVTACAASLLVALVGYRVHQRRWLRASMGAGLATLLALYAAGVLTAVPDPRAAIEGSGDALGDWAYLAVAGIAFFETAAPPITAFFPGEWGVVYGGLLASEGHIDLVVLILVVWAASALGDSWSFFLGRRFGRGLVGRMGVKEERLEPLDRFFERWGAATVAIGRLIPFARPFVALVAGASAWPYRRFLPWNLLGTGAFALAFTLLGYGAYATAERIVEVGGDAALVVVAAALLAAALAYAVRQRRRGPT